MELELKSLDYSTSFTFDTTGEIPLTGQLCLIAQGDDDTQRDGRQAYIESIEGRLIWTYQPGVAATASTTCSLFLILDTQCNGAAAIATDVFTSTALTTALSNRNNDMRFRIIEEWTETFNPNAGATGAYNSESKLIAFDIDICQVIDYSGPNGTIGEIKSNNIFFMAGSDTLSDDTVACSGLTRVNFRS